MMEADINSSGDTLCDNNRSAAAWHLPTILNAEEEEMGKLL